MVQPFRDISLAHIDCRRVLPGVPNDVNAFKVKKVLVCKIDTGEEAPVSPLALDPVQYYCCLPLPKLQIGTPPELAWAAALAYMIDP